MGPTSMSCFKNASWSPGTPIIMKLRTKFKFSSLRLIVLVLIFFQSFFLATSARKWINSFAGPFSIQIRLLTKCSEKVVDNRTTDYYIRDSRTRHKQVLMFTGNFSMPFTLDDSLGSHIKFASWSSTGGWKDNAYVLKFPKICTALKTMTLSQWKLFMQSILGEETPCPLLAGVYRFENMKVDLRKMPIKQFPYGKWRIDSLIVNGTDIRACLRGFADTVPLVD